MATTYLSAVTSEPNRDQEHHHHHGLLVSAHGAGGVMNLVNVTSGSHMTPGVNSLYPSSPRDSLSMHEMKYLPPQTHQHSIHNGHHPLASHNPWVVGLPGHDPSTGHWGMHPAAHPGLYSPQDLKQDIKPHSPGDFQSAVSRSHHAAAAAAGAAMAIAGHHHPGNLGSGWNPPPVSSPYLGMSTTPVPSGPPPGMPGAPNSPSPLQHHPAYGMNGMMGHPFVSDRYRESHNSSPRSGTDDDGMNTPTSGIFAGTLFEMLTNAFFSYSYNSRTRF